MGLPFSEGAPIKKIRGSPKPIGLEAQFEPIQGFGLVLVVVRDFTLTQALALSVNHLILV